jgi:hypothetical protein
MGKSAWLHLTHGDYSFVDPEPRIQKFLEGRGGNCESNNHEVG